MHQHQIQLTFDQLALIPTGRWNRLCAFPCVRRSNSSRYEDVHL
jgi:hypothetical protein